MVAPGLVNLPPMKRAKKLRAPKPRNPVARALIGKRGGAHRKSNRAQRKAQNDALRAAVRETD